MVSMDPLKSILSHIYLNPFSLPVHHILQLVHEAYTLHKPLLATLFSSKSIAFNEKTQT